MADLDEILGNADTSSLIKRIESGLSSLTGPAYFDGLAERLHNLLGAEYILVCELMENARSGRTFRSLVFLEPSRQTRSICYPALSTPCERTVDEKEYVCESGVAALFPEDLILKEWGAESYYGLAVKNGTGVIQGHIALLFTTPVSGLRGLGPLLKPFLQRISSETQRLRNELHLKLYRDIVSYASDMIAVIETDMTYQVVNPAYCRTFNKTPEQLLGKSPLEVFDVTVFETVIKPILEKAFSGKPQNWTGLLATPGQPGPFIHARVSPMIAPDGQISGALICANDVSALKQSQLEQQQRADILECITHNATLSDQLLQITTAIQALTGGRSAIWYRNPGKTSWEHGAHSGFSESVWQLIEQNYRPQSECSDCTDDTNISSASPELLETVRTPLWNPVALELAGHALTYCCIAPVCTDNHSLLAEIIVFCGHDDPTGSMVNTLNSVIPLTAIAIEQYHDRSNREQLEQQLRQAQKMEAIGQLTGGIAHDFNNILGSILGFAGLASVRCKDSDDEKLGLYLKEITHAGERARDLINQMLTYSRSGLHSPVPLALAPLIGGTLSLLRPMIPASIEFRMNIESSDLQVFADPAQLEQVIMNLCINSRDAIAERGNITLGLRESDLENSVCMSCHSGFEGRHVELTIRDDGKGIPRQHFEHIFEPFFTTKEIGKGSGMGLPMVHGIVHEYGGHICVESDHSGYTEVKLCFPPYSMSVAVADTGEPGHSSPEPPMEQRTRKILIVDDEEALILFYRELLTGAGFDVLHATTGKKALDQFNQQPHAIDMVITDMTMPEMSGLELARAVYQFRPDVPVILCTGFTINSELASEPSVRRFLRKPVTRNDLLGAVAEIIS